jgi:hypothetical protein
MQVGDIWHEKSLPYVQHVLVAVEVHSGEVVKAKYLWSGRQGVEPPEWVWTFEHGVMRTRSGKLVVDLS